MKSNPSGAPAHLGSWLYRAAALCFFLTLAACGGGGDNSSVGIATPIAKAVIGISTNADITVTNLEKISEMRIGRTTFDYAFKATVNNAGPAQGGVVVTLKAAGAGATIIQGVLNVGTMDANASIIPTDMIVIRQDRSLPFNTAALQFNVVTTGPVIPTTGTQKAEAVLLPGIQFLNAVDTSRIIGVTTSTITFTGDIILAPGTIFVANNTAYKVISSLSQGGTTIVTFSNPEVEDIFSTIEITGNYDVTANEAVATALPSAKEAVVRTPSMSAKASGEGKKTITDTVSFTEGSLTGTSTTSGTISINVDYKYDRALGGLQNAKFVATASVDTTLALQVSKGSPVVEKFIKGKTFFIPINLTVFDAVLNKLDAQVAGINIPVGVILNASAKFDASTSVSSRLQGTATSSYVAGVTTTTFSPVGSLTVDNPIVKPESTASAEVDAGVYLNVRPALAALRSVVLAGVDLRLGPRAALTAKAVPDVTPPYCLNVEGFLHAEASAFFKTIGFSVKSDAEIFDASIYTQPLIGSCLAPTTVAIIAATGPSTPPVFGELITIDLRVLSVPGKEVVGKVPTGSVNVKSGTKTCITVLSLAGTGRCAVQADAAGLRTPFEASYQGDETYEKSTITALFNIDKAKSFATILVEPISVVTNMPVKFTSVVGPIPDLEQSLPTGNVTFTTAAGIKLCSATLDAAGMASCSAPFTTIGVTKVFAVYAGSANYLTTKSVEESITVTGPTSTILTGAILNVPDLQANWGGLPATISLTDLVVTPKSQFQVFGNSSTCGTGERGAPVYSNVVPTAATFYAARTVTGVPYQLGRPSINRRNCSSFVAVQMIPNPLNSAQIKPRIWINGTGRGQLFSTVTFDWEYQVRFDSGDPWDGTSRSCIGGTVPNSDFFGAAWSSANCSVSLNF